jgi:hypothetical protein
MESFGSAQTQWLMERKEGKLIQNFTNEPISMNHCRWMNVTDGKIPADSTRRRRCPNISANPLIHFDFIPIMTYGFMFK